MADEKVVLAELVKMSQTLGKPDNDYVILGEGNTSARIDQDSFYVKASGKYLSQSNEETFVKVNLACALDILQAGDLSDEEIKDALFAACSDPANKLKPSIETTFHATLLSLPGVSFVGHTHPVAVNSLMCSINAQEILKGRVFPEEIVLCGIEPVYIPYLDPGLELGRVIRDRVTRYLDEQGCAPKVIVMQNHGVIACGATGHEVEAITAMWCKTCRVLAGAVAFGGVHYLTQANVERIYTRPDEHYRKEQFK